MCTITLALIIHLANHGDSTDANFIAAQAVARAAQQDPATANGEALDQDKIDAMAQLERQAKAPVGFVPASTGPAVTAPSDAPAVQASNPDEIDVDDDD